MIKAMGTKNKSIHVIDQYYITAEDGYYTIAEKYTGIKKKTGEKYDALRNLGYYMTLKQALNRIVQEYELKTASDSTVCDVKDLIGKLSVLEETMLTRMITNVSEHVKK